jgi:hypothetical protein
MVEPLNPNQSQNQPHEATHAELLRIAREDKRLIRVLLDHGENHFDDLSLFWTLLTYRQVKYFIKLHPTVHQPCILCEEKAYPRGCLNTLSKQLHLAKHCAAHAAEFHARTPI